jgi:hypothetical protein
MNTKISQRLHGQERPALYFFLCEVLYKYFFYKVFNEVICVIQFVNVMCSFLQELFSLGFQMYFLMMHVHIYRGNCLRVVL